MIPSVLLLDDELPALDRRARLLTDHYGLRVMTASSAAEARSHMRTVRGLDLILADVNLEGAGENDVSGADFAADVYELDPGIPIILYSGGRGERTSATGIGSRTGANLSEGRIQRRT